MVFYFSKTKITVLINFVIKVNNSTNPIMNIEEIINVVCSKENSAFFYTPPIYDDSFSYIFDEPVKILSAKTKIELQNNLKIVDVEIGHGRFGYSLIKYEAGYLLENKLKKLFLLPNS